ncbi:hypothetical protein [Streptomyces sp. NBC_01732]|uniref:hypothetical protein n=1 Tax=Streptomyces sp. NBC_01732 TaxID=2975926 RepID=UPI00352BF21A
MAERDIVSTTPPAVGIAEALRRRLPAGRVVTDPDIVAGLSHDQAVWAPVGRAVAVVRAKSTDEVQTVVRAWSKESRWLHAAQALDCRGAPMPSKDPVRDVVRDLSASRISQAAPR